jgi:hypothetical protein
LFYPEEKYALGFRMKLENFKDPKEKTIKEKSQKQERRVSKEVKGRPTINSGALYFDKADVRGKNLRVECKRTDKQQIVLKKEWLLKLRAECNIKDIPVVNIEIGEESWYIVRKEEFEYIRQRIEKE